MKKKKLIRQKFREDVFKRDNFSCVICGKPAKDAHHIIDRSLWPDEGYHLDNGVSLCEEDHKKAEEGKITCDELRKAAKIKKVLLPPRFKKNLSYDKWGNLLS